VSKRSCVVRREMQLRESPQQKVGGMRERYNSRKSDKRLQGVVI
jgi:hypothetical protein